jgi:uncharacterized protein YbjT (DUF2867 family)
MVDPSIKTPPHVLLTGASGYIGKRLLTPLLDAGMKVTCLIRNPVLASEYIAKGCGVMVADLATGVGIDNVPSDIDVAFFLVHAMVEAPHELVKHETKIAQQFNLMMARTQAAQVIYLSGLVWNKPESSHLRARVAIEEELKRSGIPITILRSSIIVGSGSSSFEIIRDLVEKLPLMVAPRWINNQCQPIAVDNVVELLIRVIHHRDALNKTFDIGGPDVLTFKQLLLRYASFRGLKRCIITLPVLTLKLSSLWLYFMASTNFSLSKCLVESMRQHSICQDRTILDVFDIDMFDYDKALKCAFSAVKKDAVVSSWKDPWHSASKQIKIIPEVPTHGCFKEQHSVRCISPLPVINALWAIGGTNGWYCFNWAWKLRGFIDKLVGGVGLNRGRRDQFKISVGDALDFWRVIDANKNEGRLILFAEMKMPGDAWLEWRVVSGESPRLIQTATFRPHGIFGRLYWYALYPIHFLIFRCMARSIVSVALKTVDVR